MDPYPTLYAHGSSGYDELHATAPPRKWVVVQFDYVHDVPCGRVRMRMRVGVVVGIEVGRWAGGFWALGLGALGLCTYGAR